MKYWFSFAFIALLSFCSAAANEVYIIVPDSIGDTLVCAPASFCEVEKNGETFAWKMYEPAAPRVKEEIKQPDTQPDLKEKLKRRKKIISCILAFPLPAGIIGAHRIYLGTKPYVPLVYIATIGGAVGIVPFVDFIVLLLEKDISKYQNNPNIIMWAK